MRILVATGVALVTAVSAGAPALAAPATGQVVIVHGVRGLVANVDVDGSRALSAFQPERTTDPLTLTAGTHTVAVSRANDPNSTPVLQQTVTLPAAALVAAAVGLSPEGKPALTLFNERGAPVPTGQARLVVRHIAAAPTVTLSVDGKPLSGQLSGGPKQVLADLPAGKHALSAVGPDGTPVTPPQDLPLRAGTVTTLYLIGSQPEGTLTWLARVSDSRALAGVPTGTEGLAAATHRSAWPVAALVLAVLVLVVPVPRTRRRRG